MPVIGSVVLAEKRIYLAAGVRSYHPVDDLYKEMRALRRTDETLRVFPMPLVASGNVAKGGGKFTPRLVTFNDGWRVVPEDTSHMLDITGEQITDDGQAGPAVMDFDPLSSTSKVVVNYQAPEAEIIATDGGGFLETDRTDIQEIRGRSQEIAGLLGLELGESVVTSKNLITFGTVQVSITTSSDGTVTLTRIA